MSLAFSSPTDQSGIIELIDSNCGTSLDTYSLAEKTRDVNLAWDRVMQIIFKAGGRWKWDDSNQIDYAIITTNLIGGVRDYPFVTDQQGNLILDIFKVVVANPTSGFYYEVDPVDAEQDQGMNGFFSGQNLTGQPNRYDKNANAIFLDPIPATTIANGLKIYINREGTYFKTTDTTKKAGFPGIFHEYLALRPSYFKAVRLGLGNQNSLYNAMIAMEAEINDWFGARGKDEHHILKDKNLGNQNHR